MQSSPTGEPQFVKHSFKLLPSQRDSWHLAFCARAKRQRLYFLVPPRLGSMLCRSLETSLDCDQPGPGCNTERRRMYLSRVALGSDRYDRAGSLRLRPWAEIAEPFTGSCGSHTE